MREWEYKFRHLSLISLAMPTILLMGNLLSLCFLLGWCFNFDLFSFFDLLLTQVGFLFDVFVELSTCGNRKKAGKFPFFLRLASAARGQYAHLRQFRQFRRKSDFGRLAAAASRQKIHAIPPTLWTVLPTWQGTRSVCSKKREVPCPPVRSSFLGPTWLIGY